MRAMLASLFVLSQTLFASYCPFCDPAVIERQAFYEDDLVIVLYNYKPIFPGHSLIIPKRHIENFAHLTEEEITQIGRAIKKTHLLVSEVFRTSPYLIAEKNGREVGQSVPHIHFHYIPRKKGEDSILYFLWRSCLAQIQNPLPLMKMQEITNLLQEANRSPLPPEEKTM